jgi:hypothetical protein
MTHHDVMKDKDYDLVSTLCHALLGMETSSVYLSNAETGGDEEAAKFFRDTQSQYMQVADKAKSLLSGKRLVNYRGFKNHAS